MPTRTSVSGYGTRAPRACENCRQTKKRCRPPFPCRSCARSGLQCLVREIARYYLVCGQPLRCSVIFLLSSHIHRPNRLPRRGETATSLPPLPDDVSSTNLARPPSSMHSSRRLDSPEHTRLVSASQDPFDIVQSIISNECRARYGKPSVMPNSFSLTSSSVRPRFYALGTPIHCSKYIEWPWDAESKQQSLDGRRIHTPRH